jgi:sulfopyruvate decarboxylase TPP-binding subunit
MAWVQDVVDGLLAAEIDLVAQLPDGATEPIVERLEEAGTETGLVEREESAVAAAAGTWLSGSLNRILIVSTSVI